MVENTTTAVDTFHRLLEKVRSKQLPLISLRPKEISENAAYEGDYDLFLPPEYMNELFEIVFDLAVEGGSSFTINRYKHGKAVIILHNRADNRSIFLEIWNMLSVKDPYKKTIRYIYPEQLKSHIVFADNREASFSLEIEALYYLSHLHTGAKKTSTPLVRYRISHYETALAQAGSAYAIWFRDLSEGTIDIKTAAHRANMELADKEVLFLRTDIGAVIRETKTKAASSARRMKRQWLQSLKTVPVVGPDGVGKTTIIESLLSKASVKIGYFRFKKLFRSSPFYRLAFPLLRGVLNREFRGERFIGKTEVDDRFASIVFFNALLFLPFRILINRLAGKVIFVDRYFHDYLLTDVRLRREKAGLRKNWRGWLRLIPNPYWFIHLDASAEVILSRKTELSEEGILAYRYGVFRACLEKPMMIYSYVNTESSSEACSDLLIEIAAIADIELRKGE